MFTVSVVKRPVNTIVVDQGATVTDCSEIVCDRQPDRVQG